MKDLDVTSEVRSKVKILNNAVNEFSTELNGMEVNANLLKLMRDYKNAYSIYSDHDGKTNTDEEFYQSAANLAIFSQAISLHSHKPNSLLFMELSNDIKSLLNERVVLYNEGEKTNTSAENNHFISSEVVKVESKKIDELNVNLSMAEAKFDRLEKNLFARVDDLISKVESVKSDAENHVERVTGLYAESEIDLKEKKESVDSLLGKISEGVISRSYDESAAAEKIEADWLRKGSLFCMVVIALVVGYSLYETTLDAFKWENSFSRFIFTLLLSVPAAYLARESAKHRNQQYSHLQTSLDLKAIGPYLASFPVDEQNKIKSDIAKRLFAPKQFNEVENSIMPINAQEILLKLVEKMSINGK